jgi:hypothetical protein
MSKGGRPPVDATKYIGMKYFKLTIIESIGLRWCGNQNKPFVKVLCDCGNEKEHPLSFVVTNKIQSCGCLRGFRVFDSHGLCKHPLYGIWATIKTRCYNKKHPNYPRWGGLGVRVCKEWLNDFEAFYNWCMANGWKRGLQIDKDIKAKKMGVKPIIYSPDMCMIVTPRQNARCRKDTKTIYETI